MYKSEMQKETLKLAKIENASLPTVKSKSKIK